MAGAAVRDVRIELLTEKGRVLNLDATSRRRPNPTAATSSSAPGAAAAAADAEAASTAAAAARAAAAAALFPLVVTPVAVPWFDTAADYTSAKQRQAAATARALTFGSESGSGPHVLFVGLAFLSQLVLTIDTDTLRMTAVK